MKLTISSNVRLVEPARLKAALIASALDIEHDAKQNLTNNGNVVTGRLRASIAYSMADHPAQMGTATAETAGIIAENPGPQDAIRQPAREMVALIGTNVHYAGHIEYGTVRAGQGGIWSYLRRALIGQKPNVEQRFKQALADSLKGNA